MKQSDLYGALYAFSTGEAEICETELEAVLLMDFISSADGEYILTKKDGIEFEEACEKLDTTPELVDHIHGYTMMDGASVLVCYNSDYHLA